MNIIRAGREVIVNSQKQNQDVWKDAIAKYGEVINRAQQDQRSAANPHTPRGKAKVSELVKKYLDEFVDEIRRRKAIKNSDVEKVTQFLIYKSFPKDLHQDREIYSERVEKFLLKIPSQSVKTSSAKQVKMLDPKREERLKSFCNSFGNPTEAADIGNGMLNWFPKGTPLYPLAEKMYAFLTELDPDTLLIKGKELHNFCLKETHLSQLLHSWTETQKSRREAEGHRFLRTFAKCLFDLRNIMQRYPVDEPPTEFAVAPNKAETVAPVSLDLCMAFFRAGMGLEAKEVLIHSAPVKSEATKCRMFLQEAKKKFQQMSDGKTRLSFNVETQIIDQRENPFTGLNGDEKSRLLSQFIHSCCMSELSKISQLFPKDELSIDCYFAAKIDQKGLEAFDKIDKCLAKLVAGTFKTAQEKEAARKNKLAAKNPSPLPQISPAPQPAIAPAPSITNQVNLAPAAQPPLAVTPPAGAPAILPLAIPVVAQPQLAAAPQAIAPAIPPLAIPVVAKPQLAVAPKARAPAIPPLAIPAVAQPQFAAAPQAGAPAIPPLANQVQAPPQIVPPPKLAVGAALPLANPAVGQPQIGAALAPAKQQVLEQGVPVVAAKRENPVGVEKKPANSKAKQETGIFISLKNGINWFFSRMMEWMNWLLRKK